MHPSACGAGWPPACARAPPSLPARHRGQVRLRLLASARLCVGGRCVCRTRRRVDLVQLVLRGGGQVRVAAGAVAVLGDVDGSVVEPAGGKVESAERGLQRVELGGRGGKK